MAEIVKNKLDERIKNAETEIKDNTKENKLVEQLEGGLEQAKGFLLEELIKIGTANPNKTIDVNDDNVKQAVQSLIYADPDDSKNRLSGGGALSIVATIKDNEKKITEWISKGSDAKAFEAIRKEMQKLPDALQQELSTQKGIDNLINERVKNNILKRIPFFIDDNNNLRGINAIEKNSVINKINKDVEIPQNIVSTLLQDERLLNPLMKEITENANKFFGKEETEIEGACVLDEKKLTAENIRKFTEATNHTIKTFDTIQQGLSSSIDINQNRPITETLLPIFSNLPLDKLEQNGTKFTKNLAPLLEKQGKPLAEATKSALSKLDIDYVTQYSDPIINELQGISNKGTSLWEKVKQVFTGKNYLQERLEQSVNKFNIASDEYVKKEIDNKIFSNALTNDQIADSLKNFVTENKATNIDPNNIDPNKINLVELRKINPQGFDKTMFSSPHKQETIQPPAKTPNPPLINKEMVR